MDVKIIVNKNELKIAIDISSLAKGVYYASINGVRKIIVKTNFTRIEQIMALNEKRSVLIKVYFYQTKFNINLIQPKL